MEIRLLRRREHRLARQCGKILAEAFDCYAARPMREMRLLLAKERILLVALERGRVLGLIGAIPQYGLTGWELHPLAVRADSRGRGIGAALVRALEAEVLSRGGVMLYLGTDDTRSATTLSGVDLYADTYRRLADIRNLARHPYEFYQKQGYALVGVFPDANGLGKPDLWMAKTLVGRA